VLPSPFPKDGGRYGEVLDMSRDAKMYSSTFGHKSVFVSVENSKEWTMPSQIHVESSADVRTLGRADELTLIRGSQSTVFISQKSVSRWKNNDSLALPSAFEATGNVSMSEIDQEIIAVLTKGSNGHSIVFLWRNDTSDRWQFEYDGEVPGAAVPVDMEFCRNELLAVSGEVSGIERMVFLFAKEENGKFVLSETIRQSEYDRNPGRHLKFATSIAWDSDYCWRLAISSVASDDDSSCVHVYQLRHIPQFHRIISQST
jgi:hypothetical protein